MVCVSPRGGYEVGYTFASLLDILRLSWCAHPQFNEIYFANLAPKSKLWLTWCSVWKAGICPMDGGNTSCWTCWEWNVGLQCDLFLREDRAILAKSGTWLACKPWRISHKLLGLSLPPLASWALLQGTMHLNMYLLVPRLSPALAGSCSVHLPWMEKVNESQVP